MIASNSPTKSPMWWRSKKIITYSRSSLQIIKHDFTKWIFVIANIMPSLECENILNYDLFVYTKNFPYRRARSTGDLLSSLYPSTIQRWLFNNTETQFSIITIPKQVRLRLKIDWLKTHRTNINSIKLNKYSYIKIRGAKKLKNLGIELSYCAGSVNYCPRVN